MITVAKQKAKKVVMSSIPPRGDSDPDELTAKILSVNMKFKEISDEEDITFVNNDPNFRYGNGELDDSLLQVDRV